MKPCFKGRCPFGGWEQSGSSEKSEHPIRLVHSSENGLGEPIAQLVELDHSDLVNVMYDMEQWQILEECTGIFLSCWTFPSVFMTVSYHCGQRTKFWYRVFYTLEGNNHSVINFTVTDQLLACRHVRMFRSSPTGRLRSAKKWHVRLRRVEGDAVSADANVTLSRWWDCVSVFPSGAKS